MVEIDYENQSVANLKELIAGQLNIPANSIRLIFQGRVLQDLAQLTDYELEEECTIHLVRTMPGRNRRASRDGPQPAPEANQQRRDNRPVINVSHRQIDLGNILQNMLGGMQQQTQQTQRQQASTTTRQPLRTSSIRDMITQYNTIHQGMGENLQTLNGLLNRESQLSTQEREQMQQLARTLGQPMGQMLNVMQQLQPVLSNLESGGSAGQGTTVYNQPQVTNFHVHVHARVDELDSVPERLRAIQSQINHVPSTSQQQHMPSGSVPNNILSNLGGNIQIPRATIISANEDGQTSATQLNTAQSSALLNAASGILNSTTSNNSSSNTTSNNNNNNTANNNNNNNNNGFGNILQMASSMLGNSNLNNIVGNFVQQATANGNANAFSSMQNLSSMMGGSNSSSSSSENPSDNDPIHLMTADVLQSLDVRTMMGALTGSVQYIDQLQTPMRNAIIKRLLNNNPNHTHRIVAIERNILNSIQLESLDEHVDRFNTDVDVVKRRIKSLLRTYLGLIVNVTLDGPSSHEDEKYFKVDTTSNHLFGDALIKITKSCCHDLVALLLTLVKDGRTDVKKILVSMTRMVLDEVPENYRATMRALGGTILSNRILKFYDELRSSRSNISSVETKPPTASSTTTPRVSSTTTPRVSTQPKRTTSKPKPTPETRVSANEWKQGLTTGEIKMIESTLRRDKQTMDDDAMVDDDQEFSHWYIKGTPMSAKEKAEEEEKQRKKEESLTEQTTTQSEEAGEDDDMLDEVF
eukprot:CAMPEP_0117425666 /NCGR_PEP_ID=MMETSP0758-20121206/5917_1 /TAXON_ID=63605 /ORGANISM="Percolomonas cosmopolitus, Strain AE-1 (ATCC 50343)" /LENGTH=752 /DNA_ID=CAMNT_0005210337 /DNA_START=127 /DNA_END=2382 /DNA_ORIENTATION=+